MAIDHAFYTLSCCSPCKRILIRRNWGTGSFDSTTGVRMWWMARCYVFEMERFLASAHFAVSLKSATSDASTCEKVPHRLPKSNFLRLLFPCLSQWKYGNGKWDAAMHLGIFRRAGSFSIYRFMSSLWSYFVDEACEACWSLWLSPGPGPGFCGLTPGWSRPLFPHWGAVWWAQRWREKILQTFLKY